MSKFGLRKLGFGILLFGMAVCCYTASPVKAAETDVPIDNKTFPDATFLKYVGRFDKSGDGRLSESERNAVKEIVVMLILSAVKPKSPLLQGLSIFQI